MGSRSNGNYTNPCLTMHQPWASLLVYGIKRIEGRSWPAPLRGRLWIHAASKIPDLTTIKAMEDFYKEIYAVNGITDLKFPEHYPVSRLLGCVEVVGCLKCEELACWEKVPEAVRLEGQTNFCWLCEQPQKLLVPFEMRGNQGVYNLERKIYEAAVRGLCLVESPFPVKFPLPDPRDPFSLKPGSITLYSTTSELEKPPSLTAAIAGAQAAATQFSKEPKYQTNTIQRRDTSYSIKTRLSKSKLTVEERSPEGVLDDRYYKGDLTHNYRGRGSHMDYQGSGGIGSSFRNQAPHTDLVTNERSPDGVLDDRSYKRDLTHNYRGKGSHMDSQGGGSIGSSLRNQAPHRDLVTNERSPDGVLDDRSYKGDMTHNYSGKGSHIDSQGSSRIGSSLHSQAPHRDLVPNERSPDVFDDRSYKGGSTHNYRGKGSHMDSQGSSIDSSLHNQAARRDLNQMLGAPSKIFAAAVRGVKPA